MSYRLIDANALNGVISNNDYEKVLNVPCIFADLANGLDGKHYNLQEPCEDAISRRAVLEYIEKSDADLGHISENEFMRQDIKEFPPVNPQEPRWIPVSKKLPEENKTVMASTEYCVYPEARYTKEDGWEWAYESGADYWKELEDVTAWMPLPKKYKPQESED